jgi:hypothetical protein
MNRLSKLQLIGPAFLFAAVLAAEAGAYALSMYPSSETLWYVNLKVFGLFQRSYYVLDSRTGLPGFELFFIATPIVVLASIGIALRRRLLLAISSNLSLVFALFLFYSWSLTQPRTLQASLNVMAVPTGPDLYLIGILLAGSLLSCGVSHFIYVRFVRAGRRCLITAS